MYHSPHNTLLFQTIHAGESDDDDDPNFFDTPFVYILVPGVLCVVVIIVVSLVLCKKTCEKKKRRIAYCKGSVCTVRCFVCAHTHTWCEKWASPVGTRAYHSMPLLPHSWKNWQSKYLMKCRWNRPKLHLVVDIPLCDDVIIYYTIWPHAHHVYLAIYLLVSHGWYHRQWLLPMTPEQQRESNDGGRTWDCLSLRSSSIYEAQLWAKFSNSFACSTPLRVNKDSNEDLVDKAGCSRGKLL